MTSYDERMAAMAGSDSDSDYLEMKPYVKPKRGAPSSSRKKKNASTPKAILKANLAKKASSGSPAVKRKRASASSIKVEPGVSQSEDYGLSELFATPTHSQTNIANHALYGSSDAGTSFSSDIFSPDQGFGTAFNPSAFSYSSAFADGLSNDYGSSSFHQSGVPGTSHSFSSSADPSVFDGSQGGIYGETQQVSNTVSPFQNDSSRYEGSESEDERPRKAAKLNKDGVPRKPRRPRPRLLKWSDDDWKNVILGIVWACGEANIQIPFAQAAKVVGEHCTAGALQQALLKLRGKQIAEGYDIPNLKMAWTRKNRSTSSSLSSSANSMSVQECDTGKAVSRQTIHVDGVQSKLVILKRAYTDQARQGIPYPYKWNGPSQNAKRSVSWETAGEKRDTIDRPEALSSFGIHNIPNHASATDIPIDSHITTPNNPYTQAMQIQQNRGRRPQNHRNGKVSSGSGEITPNPAGSVNGVTATFHDYADAEEIFIMDPLDDVHMTTSEEFPVLQHSGKSSGATEGSGFVEGFPNIQCSEKTLGLLEGRSPAAGLSELRTDFAFPERPTNLGQSSTGTPAVPQTSGSRSIAGRRQGHRRTHAIIPGALFDAGTKNMTNSANANNTKKDNEKQISYDDIVANTTLIHTPGTPNRLAQVYSPGYIDSPVPWQYRIPATPENTVTSSPDNTMLPTPETTVQPASETTAPSTPKNSAAAKNQVSFLMTPSACNDGASDAQGNHTMDLNGGMIMAHASYENLLAANDTEGLQNGFADMADDIFG